MLIKLFYSQTSITASGQQETKANSGISNYKKVWLLIYIKTKLTQNIDRTYALQFKPKQLCLSHSKTLFFLYPKKRLVNSPGIGFKISNQSNFYTGKPTIEK